MKYYKISAVLLSAILIVSSCATDKVSSMIGAAKSGDTGKINSLISDGVDINSVNGIGETALMAAGKYGRIDVVRQIIKHGANLNLVNHMGKTALMISAGHGRREIVDILVKAGAKVNLRDKLGKTALIYSAGRGGAGIAKKLIDAGSDAEIKDHLGKTALMIASAAGFDNVARTLIDNGASPNARDRLNKTALMIAVENNRDKMVVTLLKAKADIGARDDMGRTAMAMSQKLPDSKITSILLARGGGLNSRDSLKRTPLMAAAINGNDVAIEKLVQSRANVNATDMLNKTALMFAAQNGHESSVDLLIRSGAKMNLLDKNGVAAIGHAARNGLLGVITTLLANGANVMAGKKESLRASELAKNSDHKKAYYRLMDAELLTEAVKVRSKRKMEMLFRELLKYGAVATLEELISRGFDVNTVFADMDMEFYYISDEDIKSLGKLAKKHNILPDERSPVRCSSLTPLHIALATEFFEIVNTLIRNGAVIDSRDSCGRTPLAVASIRDNIPMALVLLSHGASPDVTLPDWQASPYMLSAKRGDSKVFRAIAVMAEEPDKRDKFGFTALHWAVMKGKSDILSIAVGNGADINLKDGFGMTPLHRAIAKLKETVNKERRKNRAVEIKEEQAEFTPLQWKVIRKKAGIIQSLLILGADMEIETNDGLTAMDMLEDEPVYESVIEELENALKEKDELGDEEELADEKADPLLKYLQIKSRFDFSWFGNMFSENQFCSYKTVRGPRIDKAKKAYYSTVECIGGLGGTARFAIERRLDYHMTARNECGCKPPVIEDLSTNKEGQTERTPENSSGD